MTITLAVTLTCDHLAREYDPGSACGETAQGAFTLTREREHELTAPEGWVIRTESPFGGSYRHDSRMDLDDVARAEAAEERRGDAYHVRCPRHAES